MLAARQSQAIGKRLSGRLNGTSLAPEFTPKHNSELSDNRGRRPHDAVRLEIGETQGWRAAPPKTCFAIGAVRVSLYPERGCVWPCRDARPPSTV